MARKPLRPCNAPSCRNLTRERYCEEHKQIEVQQNKARHNYYDKYQRDKDAAAFYKSVAWQRMREQALQRDLGLCQHCFANKEITLADMVDHIIPIKLAWEYRLWLDNLQSLCNRCHAAKTAEDKREYGGRV
ncbi:HNH endonuclease [Bacillus sp. FJAT-49705]|uniref:Putative HNH nuclease YajD n=1 Tax=Cytobacillus citreus TaxID=2833586 RepID=A0ABS5NVA3_9BACI|nr:HNH endonuclease [Cytobacillus citreus]MBS4191756.1 HNH endonuclease [Cytobacillus citreus]